MAAEQLERSILERKERDELHAIASAMSLKPTARSKKADIIDLILRATGVDTADGAGTTAGGRPNGTGSEAAPASGGAAARTKASAGAKEDAGAGDSMNDGTLASSGGKADADGTAPARGRGRTPRRAAVSATQLELGDGDPLVAERSNGARNGSEAAGEHEGSGAERADGAEPASGTARTASGPAGGHSPAGRAGSTAARLAGSEGAAERSGESGQRSFTRERAGGEGSNGDHAPGGSVNVSGNGSSVASLVTAGLEASAEATVVAPAAPSHPGAGSDLGNRRGRRRRGRDRERGESTSGSEPAAWQGELVPVRGLLDLREEGYGFLRTSGYLASSRDVYVSVSQARRFALRKGDAIEGACRPAGASEKYPALIRIDSVGGLPAEEARNRPRFEDLTPLFPDEKLRLEIPGDPANPTARIVDLVSPIGKGQRGMIVSPSKAGKTTILKQIAHSIETNNPDVHLIVLLVDERPEEVTDMRRSVKGEVIASTFDRPADEHTAIAELTIERAKRLVELGKDVVIILDGITRLARAYNLAQPATGRIMSGGVDSGALYPPKRFYGAARNIEEGGSLTILATALVETGSKMDEVIFEEFKGTGNMELRLDRKLAERRLYPAIDVNASSTRHEELLFDRSQLQQVWKLRRVLNALSNEGSAAAGLELLIDKIRTTKSNDEFLAEIAKAPVPTA
ncbi:MAG TPA: transcription termination factor Rho [Acidimicrobiales bacterium]|nr:transcription termination factor Rho [Acidimicrobiales bacterium]